MIEEEGFVVAGSFSVEPGIYSYPATPFDNLVASRGVYNVSRFAMSGRR